MKPLSTTIPAIILLLITTTTVSAQTISTIAGTGTIRGFSGDCGRADTAKMGKIYGLAYDPVGNLFIADVDSHRVRKVTPAGMISTFAGNGAAYYWGTGGPTMATATGIGTVTGIATDAVGNVYLGIPEGVLKVTPGGIIIKVAGDPLGSLGFSGDGGPATMAVFHNTAGIAVDALGNILVCDMINNRVRKVDLFGTVRTIAGNGVNAYSGDGGPATLASLRPFNITIDGAGNLLIADGIHNTIRKVSTAGIITTVAGTGVVGYSGDGGPATAARFSSPNGLAVDQSGNLYINDETNGYVRRVSPSGIISSIAGNGTYSFSGDGGPATACSFRNPWGLAVNCLGDVAVADQDNFCVRMIRFPHAGAITSGAADTVCMGDTLSLASTATGGVWSNKNTHTHVTGGRVTGLTAGRDTIIYAVTNACTTDTSIHTTDSATFIVTVKDCRDHTQSTNIYNVGNKLCLWPDPNNGTGTLYLSSPINEPVQITITDLMGRPVHQLSTTTNRSTEINLNTPTGLYFVNATTSHGIYQVKMAVVR